MSRQQEHMRLALAAVNDVIANHQEVAKDYGRLCHQVPVLLLANGLGLTIAYLQSRSRREDDAFGLVLTSLAGLLGLNREGLAGTISTVSPQQYMLGTFDVLDAWVFYKRFAISLLGVEAGDTEPLEEVPA